MKLKAMIIIIISTTTMKALQILLLGLCFNLHFSLDFFLILGLSAFEG